MWQKLKEKLLLLKEWIIENWKIVVGAIVALFAFVFKSSSKGVRSTGLAADIVRDTSERLEESTLATTERLSELGESMECTEDRVLGIGESIQHLTDREQDIESTVGDIRDTISRIRTIVEEGE